MPNNSLLPETFKTRLISTIANHQRSHSLSSQAIPLIPCSRDSIVSVSVSVSDSGYPLVADEHLKPGAVVVHKVDKDHKTTVFYPIDINMSYELPLPVTQTITRGSSVFSHNESCDERRGTSATKKEKAKATTTNLKTHLWAEVDEAHCTAPLSAYCFMTGFIDSVIFSAVFVWCAFQTGNSIQLSLAIARLLNRSNDSSFHIADQQALCSVLTFISGAFIGRVGDKIGCRTRLWLSFGTFIQTVFTLAAAICIWQSNQGSVANTREDPVWTNVLSFVCIGFMSASMGLQGIMGKRLNTQFTTTVVLTTTWCELMADPSLFNLRRLVKSRDHKILAIASVFLGGLVGRIVLDQFGAAGTLCIGTGIRLFISAWWLFIPEVKVPVGEK